MWTWLSDGWARLPVVRGRLGVGMGASLPRRGAPPPEQPEVPDPDGALSRIAAEFERARRYERSVTVAVFSLDDPRADAPGHASSTTHLCPVVREVVRETDLVVCDPVSRRCVVVMPEIGAEEGRRAVTRMRELCASQLQCPVRGDLAVFPRDGWVFPDLVEAAEKQARSETAGPISQESLGG